MSPPPIDELDFQASFSLAWAVLPQTDSQWVCLCAGPWERLSTLLSRKPGMAASTPQAPEGKKNLEL